MRRGRSWGMPAKRKKRRKGKRDRQQTQRDDGDMLPSFELPHHQNALSCYITCSFSLSFSFPFIQKETIVFASESKFLSLPRSLFYLSETLHDLCHYAPMPLLPHTPVCWFFVFFASFFPACPRNDCMKQIQTEKA